MSDEEKRGTFCKSRHWFAVYGVPGLRAPVCQRCGAPNPRPLNDEERLEYEDFIAARSRARQKVPS